MKKYLIFTLSFVLFFSLCGFTQTIPVKHTILKLADLITEIDRAQWLDQQGTPITLNENYLSRNKVFKAKKQGVLSIARFTPWQNTRNLEPESVYADAIQVKMHPSGDNQNSLVRGIYTQKLPEMKKIQLEVDTDTIVSPTNKDESIDLYVEVHEKGANADWVSTKEFHKNEIKSAIEKSTILELKNDQNQVENFVTHTYNVDLSPWSGKEIQIVLASQMTNPETGKAEGRWTNAKLVGATFDIVRIVENKVK